MNCSHQNLIVCLLSEFYAPAFTDQLTKMKTYAVLKLLQVVLSYLYLLLSTVIIMEEI